MQAVNSNSQKELEKTASETVEPLETEQSEQPPVAAEVGSLAVVPAPPVDAVVVVLAEVDEMKPEEKEEASFCYPWWKQNSADRACKRRQEIQRQRERWETAATEITALEASQTPESSD